MSLSPNLDHEFVNGLPCQLRFWGVRHGIPAPGKDTVRYGGNTPCLELNIGNNLLIFDAGTGLRALGNHLLGKMPCHGHIFFTHGSWDRIQGFPFFVPAFIPGNFFEIYGAPAADGSTIAELLSAQMTGPNFPVPMGVMASKLIFHDLAVENTTYIAQNQISIDTMILDKQYNSIAYRVTWEQQSLVYATDIHSNWQNIREQLLQFTHQSNVLIIDAPGNLLADINAQEEFLTLVEELGEKSQTNTLIVSLHQPDYHDDLLDQLALKSSQSSLKILFAKEGHPVNI